MLRERGRTSKAVPPTCDQADRGLVTFGQLLRAKRSQHGLSLNRFAAMVHFDPGHVSKVETDKRAPSVSFAAACDRTLQAGNTFTTIATALEASARRQQRGWVRPAQLPAAQRHFVARQHYLGQLDALCHGDLRSPAVPVVVINGQPGVGKTALAVQWAHRAVSNGHFADGQLFIDLGGPGSATAVPPADLLAEVLHALGVPPKQVPAQLAQRSATLRSLLHDREVLLVLDNAADAKQIQSLLPGHPGCAVVVTSRVWLPGSTSLAGAVTLTLPELSQPEATSLMRSIIGSQSADADPQAMDLVVERCARLPLALILAAEHIVAQQHHSTSALAEHLKTEPARLDLAAGEVSVRCSFDSSYRLLDEPTSHLFRSLGRHPSNMIDAATAATAAGIAQNEAALLLRNLANANLIRRHNGYYELPDLLRCYATEMAARDWRC